MPLKQLFFGHVLGCHLSIAGVDAGVTGADQRLLGLRLVDFDVFLQAVNSGLP